MLQQNQQNGGQTGEMVKQKSYDRRNNKGNSPNGNNQFAGGNQGSGSKLNRNNKQWSVGNDNDVPDCKVCVWKAAYWDDADGREAAESFDKMSQGPD